MSIAKPTQQTDRQTHQDAHKQHGRIKLKRETSQGLINPCVNQKNQTLKPRMLVFLLMIEVHIRKLKKKLKKSQNKIKENPLSLWQTENEGKKRL